MIASGDVVAKGRRGAVTDEDGSRRPYPGKKASSEKSAKPAEIPIRSDVRKWNVSQLEGVTVPFSMLLVPLRRDSVPW